MASVSATYKAFVYDRLGPVSETLQLREVPTEPLAASQVRIKVHSAALNPVDWKVAEIYGGKILKISDPTPENPFRIGFDVAGVIAEVADGVDGFKVGDEVYAMAGAWKFGSIAEYFSIGVQFVAHKPKNLDFDHAAGIPLAALTSYQALSEPAQGNLQAGQRVLILGGSSGTGVFAIQHAKAVGAHVIATTSTKNVDFVKSLGADEVIDYRTQKWGEVLPAHSVDVIYDCGFEPDSWADVAQEVLKKETGRFVSIGGKNATPSKYGAVNTFYMTNSSGADLTKITELIESNKVKSIVDSVFSFDKTVDAFERLKTGRAVGKVIVKVQ